MNVKIAPRPKRNKVGPNSEIGGVCRGRLTVAAAEYGGQHRVTGVLSVKDQFDFLVTVANISLSREEGRDLAARLLAAADSK